MPLRAPALFRPRIVRLIALRELMGDPGVRHVGFYAPRVHKLRREQATCFQVELTLGEGERGCSDPTAEPAFASRCVIARRTTAAARGRSRLRHGYSISQ